MSFAYLPNRLGALFWPAPYMTLFSVPSTATALIDAAAETLAMIGRVHLTSGPGTSKTISSAGGKFYMMISSATWANGSTIVRAGIQDVASTGLQDGTFDTYVDLVPGVDTITGNAINTITMTTGTKTIADGDLVAVAMSMTARGGTDAISALRFGSGVTAFPYATNNGTRLAIGIPTTIQFDDGTLGFFDGDYYAYNGLLSTASFGSGSTPDEYALLFQVPVPLTITALAAKLGAFAQTDDFELILYSDPLGTPVAERTIAVDADQTIAQTIFEQWINAYSLTANTTYAIAVRPTVANTLNVATIEFSSIPSLRACTLFGTTARQGSRTNQSGAFSEDTNVIPLIGFRAAALDDGTAVGGGSEASHVFVG